MNEYKLHPEAFADLDEIRSYIAEDNPDAADRVITEIFDRIRPGGVSTSGLHTTKPHVTRFAVRPGT